MPEVNDIGEWRGRSVLAPLLGVLRWRRDGPVARGRAGVSELGRRRPRQGAVGGQGVLRIPPMPTWAMISVIAGWIIGWSVIGARRMMTRDA